MTDTITLREPPSRTGAGSRPVLALDQRIMEVAKVQMRPVEIARIVHEDFPDATTQRVASRLKALVSRGFMERIRPTGGPANGPGTSYYRTKKDD
jgi:hypothetical protein